MTQTLAPRSRKVKILATLGPASSDLRMIRKLMLAGADAFRINMSHGDQKQKAKLVDHIRALEKEFRRPTTILFDLQGPKLRVSRRASASFSTRMRRPATATASSCRTPNYSNRFGRAPTS